MRVNVKTIINGFVGFSVVTLGLLSGQSTQAPNPTQQSAVNTGAPMPIYRVTVVARTTKAINYNHRSGSTNIGFRGTALLPEATGEASVESKQGVIKINARMQHLQPATKYGPEYLTYVMWAITPEGRATNVGEVLLNGTNSKLDATTELQSFGLIITAEPYFAVTQPSDVVVMENFARRDTTGTIEEVDAKYELLQRGQYTLNVNPADIRPLRLDPRVPLELFEARNAVQIARWTGAQQYAAETFQKAVIGLENAEGYLQGKAGKKPIGTVAREAVQMAEDARIITIRKMQEATLASERQAATDREASARADAERETQAKLQAQLRERSEAEARMRAESDRATAESNTARIRGEAEAARVAAQNETDRVRRDTDAQRLLAQNETDRVKRETDAQRAAAQDETDRMKRETDAQRAAAQIDIALAGKEKAEAEVARADAVQQQQLAQAETGRAHLATQEADRLRQNAETEKTQLRAQLLRQFNLILQTRDTARGLIVNMSDVLFDTARYTLRPGAREKLAKIGGIVSGHPGLKMEVEGYTDSVGGDSYNQRLSEQRSDSVRDYLTHNGVDSALVTSKGFGKSQPVAGNETAAGRQQNRRVELVISGEIIGMQIGTADRVLVVR
jgi:outer membrane protein OmpA-like peptidoglycan-associated protein